jgi:hypothetical protein
VVDSPSPGGSWGPRNYALTCDQVINFVGQNEGDEPNAIPCIPSLPILTEVEYAVAVSPVTPTILCKPTDNFAVAINARDEYGLEVPEAQGHARVIVNKPPLLGPVSPSTGSGPTMITTYFTTTWLDRNSWRDLKHVYFHIGPSPSLENNVTLLYNVFKGKLWIRSDDGTSWTGGYAPGTAEVLENSQAKVYCAQTEVYAAGDALSVKWAIEFQPNYVGLKKLGLKCKDALRARAKGKWRGSWMIED